MVGRLHLGIPVSCPHCASVGATRWQITEKGARYRCPRCGDYRIAIAIERTLDRPAPPGTAGRFVTNGGGIRWLMAE